MPLHRLTVPTYNGGLPGTHDYINDPATNGDPGAPAPADGKKGSGVNQGTYFVAFGEAATASNVNRGDKALAQNTDYLDDVLHKDVSEPVISASTIPGAPVASFVISASVYVAEPGAVNDQRTRSGLVFLTDGTGQPLVVLSGGAYVAVKATLIHDGASNNVIGNNFYSSPTVNVSPSIPTAQSYRVVYYKRSNYVSLGQGALSRYNTGLDGIADALAFAKSLDLAVPKLAATNTFTGKQIFAFPTVDQPLITNSTYNAVRTQIYEQQVSTTPTKYVRIYQRGGTGAAGGLEITINAKWTDGTALWSADSTAQPAVKYVLGGSSAGQWREFVYLAPTATFTDTTFISDTYVQLEAGLKVQAKSATASLLTVDESLTAAWLFNDYKSILETTHGSTDEGKVRVYATAVGIGTSDEFGLAITNNAKWTPGASLWTPDQNSKQATKILINPYGIKFTKKVTPGGTFNNAGWDQEVLLQASSDSPGDIEYKTKVGRVKVLPLHLGASSSSSGLLAWERFNSAAFPRLTCSTDSGMLYFPIQLPAGAVWTKVRVIVDKGSVADQMVLAVCKNTPLNFTLVGIGTVVLPTNTVIGSSTTTGGLGSRVIDVSFTETISPSEDYFIALQATSSASTDPDSVYGIQIRFNDPTPIGR